MADGGLARIAARTGGVFRNALGETVFGKYRHEGCETWRQLAHVLAWDVCGKFLARDIVEEIACAIADMEFIPGGRYLYYAGRPNKFFNNCYILKSEEDSREDWASLSWKAESCLLTGGGIGNDYSVYRAEGALIRRTGGVASGPISKMDMINEIGRRVMQGGSRRSAIYGSLNWRHADAPKFLRAKDWDRMLIPGTDMSLAKVKTIDFNYPAPLDMTNVSLNYDNAWRDGPELRLGETFMLNCAQALRTGEPGFSFNFDAKEAETGRNACTEVTSADDSDVCNLGSVNMSRIATLERFKEVCRLGSMFLLCGTLVAHLPYDKVAKVREKNRRLGLGLMGMHEWLLVRKQYYSVTPELHQWLAAYRDESTRAATQLATRLGVSVPVAFRSIAPTGTIGMLAGTTTGIEPIYAVALKRRYLKNGTDWHYQYAIDSTAKLLMELHGLDPERIETAVDLAKDVRRRMKFQADVQGYVDMAISSTINLPAWGTEHNNESTVADFATALAYFAPRLRGLTVYPDGARGGQPLTSVPYVEAAGMEGVEFAEHDACKGGVCGI